MIARLALALSLLAAPATAREVDLELVLALDASTSIDADEFELQRQGLGAAFADPEVIAAIEALNAGLAVSVIQWSGTGEQALSVGWALIGDAFSSVAFGQTVAVAPRRLSGVTDIGGAISFALAALEANGYEGRRRVIDVSADGTSDNREVWADRDRAVARGVTVNGLVVRGAEGPTHLARVDIAEHFRRDVIGGEGAFLVTAADFEGFREAIRRKLLCEIMGPEAAAEADGDRRCDPLVLGELR